MKACRRVITPFTLSSLMPHDPFTLSLSKGESVIHGFDKPVLNLPKAPPRTVSIDVLDTLLPAGPDNSPCYPGQA